MGKFLKRVGIGLGSLLLLVVILILVISTVRLKRDYQNFQVSVAQVPIPMDDASIKDGQHLATTHYCKFCHGDQFAGGFLVNEPALAVIPAPNLTAGLGGVGASNTDTDWIRAIRHGVGQDGRGLIGMPSRIWHQLSDEDLGALIAYLKTIPPVDNQLPERRIGPMFRLMLALGQAPESEAAVIDHDAPRPLSIEPGVNTAYGEYLATACTACHGAHLNGGMIRDFDGKLIIASNLTPGGPLQSWIEADFINTLRSGVTPNGRQLSDDMPWRYIGQMTDEELQALWLYLQSLPAMEQGMERTDL